MHEFSVRDEGRINRNGFAVRIVHEDSVRDRWKPRRRHF